MARDGREEQYNKLFKNHGVHPITGDTFQIESWKTRRIRHKVYYLDVVLRWRNGPKAGQTETWTDMDVALLENMIIGFKVSNKRRPRTGGAE